MSLIGLPSLPKLPTGTGFVNSILGRGQSALWQLLTLEPVWGIYEAGSSTTLAVEVDSVMEVSVSEEADVPHYRLQTNSYATYNKIAQPMEIPLRIAKGGSDEERSAFIAWLQTAARNPTVYDILTREAVFRNVTLEKYSYERTAENGEDLVIAECQFVEVREAPEQYYNAEQGQANTQNAGDADGKPTTQLKKVQPQDAGTMGSTTQNIFSLDRIKDAYSSVKQTASSIVDAITKTTTNYWEKVKGWFG